MPVYLVEFLSTDSRPVRYIRSTFPSKEDHCLCLFEAPLEATLLIIFQPVKKTLQPVLDR